MTESVKTRRLGRYVLDRLISRGGMGEIYLAHAEGAAGFRKTVCIKRILPHLAREQEFVDRFIDEAHIVVQLTHGNIVPVLDMGEDGGEYFIAMEYLAGRDLRDIIKRYEALAEQMPIPVAVYVIGEICKALSYAHKKTDPEGQPLRIIHRDVSPSNVLVSREGVVKLTDFGIAKAVGKLGKSITGRLQGKFSYMSPEQASGASVDARGDIFSVGTLAYELLCGVRPFEGESDLATLEAVRRADCDPPSTHRPELSDAVDAAIMKALSRAPEDRPEDAADLGNALRLATAELGVAGERDMAAQLTLLFPGHESGPPAVRGANLDDILADEAERMLAVSPSGESRTLTASPPTRPAAPGLGPQAVDLSPTPSPALMQTPTPSVTTAPAAPERRSAATWLSGAAVVLMLALAVVLLWVQPGWLVETRLIVSCEPDGAVVLLNNQSRGRCDVTFGDLAPGVYSVGVELQGYLSAQQEVVVTRGDDTRIDLTLQEDPLLNVRVWVEPDGRFRIGDETASHFSGEPVPLLPGEYSIHAEQAGYQSATHTFRFSAAEPETTIVLIPEPVAAEGTAAGTGEPPDGSWQDTAAEQHEERRVTLELTGLPEGATVTWDGNTRPARRLYFPADENRDIAIRIEAPGHQPRDVTFNPRRGSARMDGRLEELPRETREVRFTLTNPGRGEAFKDGERLGEVPGVYVLPIGCYMIRVENRAANAEAEREVCVQSGTTEQIEAFFTER